jgi:hypothetical protein
MNPLLGKWLLRLDVVVWRVWKLKLGRDVEGRKPIAYRSNSVVVGGKNRFGISQITVSGRLKKKSIRFRPCSALGLSRGGAASDARQSDDDPRDDHSDYFHGISFSVS